MSEWDIWTDVWVVIGWDPGQVSGVGLWGNIG